MDARQKLIEAREACKRFVITQKTGAIRPRPRAEPIGIVTYERDEISTAAGWKGYGEWYAQVGNISARSVRKHDAVEAALYRRADLIAESFLVDLLERHPTRAIAIREAVLTTWRDDPNALGGLCFERDLERALRAVKVNRSVREQQKADAQ